jgi:hypothetical protein
MPWHWRFEGLRSAALISARLGAFAGESESIFERPFIISADYNRPEAVHAVFQLTAVARYTLHKQEFINVVRS